MGQMSPMLPVHSVYYVPVASGQPCGLPCSVTSFCSSSVDLPDMSVPAHLFSLLAPVHLVSLLLFQVELSDYPDQATVACILNDRWVGFQIGFEAL